MKRNKLILPLIVGTLVLTSCGMGEEVTKEKFGSKIQEISLTSNDNVKVKGTLTSRNAEVESKIVFDYVFTYSEGDYTASKKDDVSNLLYYSLGCWIVRDYEKAVNFDSAKFYINGTTGYAISFTKENNSESVGSSSGNYTYKYDASGRYTYLSEKETFIRDGLTYTSLLEVSYEWVK